MGGWPKATGDFNGDGHQDVLITTLNGGLSVLAGDGQGGLAEEGGFACDGSTVVVGDFNQDHLPDMVTAGDGSDLSYFYLFKTMSLLINTSECLL